MIVISGWLAKAVERVRPGVWPFAGGIAVGLVLAWLASLVVVARDAQGLEPGPLIIVSGNDTSTGLQRQLLVDEWNALHKANPASIVELGPTADEQRSEMLRRAQSDSEDDDVDVYNLDVTWTAEFAEARYLRGLDETRVSTSGFLARPLASCRYNGYLWALPFNSDVGLLYYRADLLRKIGVDRPPADWDTLIAEVAALRQVDRTVAGYVGQTGDYEGFTVTAMEAIWGAGGTVVDQYGRVLPDNSADAARTGLDRLRSLGLPGLPALTEAQSLQAFQNPQGYQGHQVLFMRNWPVYYRTLRPPGADAAPVEFDVAPLPGGGALGGQTLAIAAKSSKPRAAQALIEFLTSDRSEQVLFERGGLPATRAVVYADTYVDASDPDADDKRRLRETLRDALATARPRPTQPHYAQISQAFRRDAAAYLSGTATLDTDGLRADLQSALTGRWPRPPDSG